MLHNHTVIKHPVVLLSRHPPCPVRFLIPSPQTSPQPISTSPHSASYSDTPTHSLTIGSRVEMFVPPHAQGLFEKLWCDIALWSQRLGRIWKRGRQREVWDVSQHESILCLTHAFNTLESKLPQGPPIQGFYIEIDKITSVESAIKYRDNEERIGSSMEDF